MLKIFFYHPGYCINLYSYIDNVSVDVYPGLLQVFLIELGNLGGTLNNVLYSINGVAYFDSVNHIKVHVLNIPVLLLACSQDWICKCGNTIDPIWRVLRSSIRISSWTPLKPQHSNPNPNPKRLANQLWCIDFLTPPTFFIISHRLPAFFEPLMSLKNWCSIHARWSINHSDAFHTFLRHFFPV